MKTPPPRLGERLADRFVLTAEIGRGGMGVVYRAQDTVLGREVAVKMISSGLLDAAAVERFRREARTLAQLDHPSILPIHDFGEHQDALFLVMPLVKGTSLRQRIRQADLRLGEALEIAAQVAEALDYSHARGVIHRDIKPENIMIVEELHGLRARVMDFGLARSTTATRVTRGGALLGTLAYLSPEQVGERPMDGRADLYALGTVLYECLCGEPPFSGTTEALLYRVAHEAPPSFERRGVELDGELAALVLACLAKDPAERPASGGALAAALRRLAGRLGSSLRTAVLAPRVLEPRQGLRPPPGDTPLVGRLAELGELRARLDAALAGECQLVLLAGETGSGKSRLLEELARLATVRGIRVLRGRFAERQGTLPYQGLCDLVRDYFRVREDAEVLSSPDLSDLAGDLLRLFPVFSEIEALRAYSSGAVSGGARIEPAGSHQAEATYVFELFARTLTRIADGRPLVLLLRNLHAADASIEALGYLVHRLGPTPTLFVASYRPADVERGHTLQRLIDSFEGDSRFRRLVLGPLSGEELRQLAELELGGKVDDDVVSRIERTTEGNPFFTRELVRSMRDDDELRRTASGVWRLRRKSGMTRDAVPETIQQTVKKRLQHLDEEARGALTMAAVIGRGFDFDDLEALWDGGELDELIDGLVEEGMLEEDSRSRGDRLRFASALVCDTLYRELPRRRRRKLHRLHAKRLETRWAGRLERVYPELVHHFSAGDVADKTVSYGLELARLSLSSFSFDDALRAARTALELVDEEEFADAAAVRGELLLLAARAEQLAGRADEALYEAERAAESLEEAGLPVKAAEAMLLLAETAWQGRRSDLARSWVERGLELVHGDDETRLQLLTLGALLANLRGDHPAARRYLDDAEALSGETGSDAEEEIPEGGTLVTVVPHPVATLDPIEVLGTEDSEIAGLLYEPLLTTDDAGNLRPVLCDDWESSDDGRTFTFRLRPKVCFSDGTPFEARDVRAFFERQARRQGPTAAVFSVLEGIDAVDGGRVVFRLSEPLPIFPTLLTHANTVLARVADDGSGHLLGTGPFVLAHHDTDSIRLERNAAYWRGRPARLDAIEFRTARDATEIASGLRAGELDLARDLLPEDLESIQRDPRFRSRIVEATNKNIYFVLFNTSGPAARDPAVRRALAGAVKVHDLVWRSLGRFAQPATGLVPPGILGHDPGRRSPALVADRLRDDLARGTGGGLRLRAAVHPLIRDRYGSLLAELLLEWRELGVEIVSEADDMEAFRRCYDDNAGVDLLIGRWIGDYDDPDAFTYVLFHSTKGMFRNYFSSPEADLLLQEARQQTEPEARVHLYRSFEDLLVRESAVLPLFHDVNYRIAGPRVRSLSLHGTRPYVNYTTLGKAAAEADRRPARSAGGVEIHVPILERVTTLDPTAGLIADQAEMAQTIFETLTQIGDGANVEPRLAETFDARQGGREYFVRLRRGVRFHDGRRLTARDVRASFERILRTPREEVHVSVLPILGAREFLADETAALAGIEILSASELVIRLEEPLAFFPALLTLTSTSIVPEGARSFTGSWRDGCAGTGPFRVVRFEPGERLEVERNPDYWRPGVPRSDRLVFHVGTSPEQAAEGFRRGRLTLAADLRPSDFEDLRRHPELVAGYREAPRLATYFLVFNTRRGPFADVGLRRDFARAFDVGVPVRDAGGRLTQRACGLIPPGLLGHEAVPPPVTLGEVPESVRGLRLRALAHPVFSGQYRLVWEGLRELWCAAGLELKETRAATVTEINREVEACSADLLLDRWIADYPDTDSIVRLVLYSRGGFVAEWCGTPELDRLIEAGRRETDPGLRHAVYRELEELLVREALLVPLFHEQIYRFCQPGVEGLRLRTGVPEVRYEELVVRR